MKNTHRDAQTPVVESTTEGGTFIHVEYNFVLFFIWQL